MKPGSVIVDLAASHGGNCPLTEPGQTVVKHGVTLIGATNVPALVAADASALYARNLLDFLKLIITKEGALKIDLEDDIAEAIGDSMDFDWNSTIGALAVVLMLRERGYQINPPADPTQ